MIKVKIKTNTTKGKISKNIYGHFSEHLGRCVYGGLWVGKDSPIPNTDGVRNDIIEALRDMRIPLLRWPGGCFADEYHWMDGIGEYEKRPTMINTHWGCVTEDNSFGTHEFLNLCELIGADPYINGNVGSGTVREMQQWVEYITFDGKSPMADLRRENGREKPWKLPYFGVGNESWGCGGNMLPDFYADEYRRYGTYVRNFSGNNVYKIACGPNANDFNWTEVLMKKAVTLMNGLSLHYYTVPKDWTVKGSADVFEEDEWFATLQKTLYMDELITKHKEIMDQYDADKKVGLIVDEWGCWYDAEPGTNPGFLYQQNTLRDALVAGINLNIFNNHCDRVHMANLAQLVNVLQSVILTEGEKMLLTPTYYVMKMYSVHQEAQLLDLEFVSSDYCYKDEKIPQISVSSSIDINGRIHISLCNLNPNEAAELNCDLEGAAYGKVTGTILTADQMNAKNTFEEPEIVKEAVFTGAKIENNHLTVTLPAKSVVVLEVE